MKILALECSAGPASCAVCEGGRILAQDFTNLPLTHSQTLMPMVKEMLEKANLGINDIDALAISNGPGSFTGIRIGISAIKGLAAAKKLPCYAVSTLRAIAENFADCDCTVCAVMDARCNQVYNALFKVESGKITRLCPDRALMIDELVAELSEINGEIIIAGDGTDLFSKYEGENISLASGELKYQNACGVAIAANEVDPTTPNLLMPFYLRLPQAERELKKKSGISL